MEIRQMKPDILPSDATLTVRVGPDIRPPDSAFSSLTGYRISGFYFTGYPDGYHVYDFTTIRPDSRFFISKD